MSHMLANRILAALLLLLLASAQVVEASIWTVDIEEGPAPPPDQGPPVSRNAVRDSAMLKWQIMGIAGGYVFFTGILFTLLLTAGRRLRRAAQSSSGTLSMEMVKPNRWLNASPAVSSLSPWQKWGSPKALDAKRDSGKQSNVEIQTSPVAFDEDVLEQDRIHREADMERLYAAVMEQDSKASAQQPMHAAADAPALHNQSQMGHGHQRNASSSTSSNASFKHRVVSGSRTSPTSPQTASTFVPAVYPPYGPMPSDPSAPTLSPYESIRPTSTSPPPLPPIPRDYPYSPSHRPKHHSRNPSASSSRTTASARRLGRPTSAKALRISAPIPSAPLSEADYDESTPLTPKLRTNLPPPPPIPGQRKGRAANAPRQEDEEEETYTDIESDLSDAEDHPAQQSAAEDHYDQEDIISHYSSGTAGNSRMHHHPTKSTTSLSGGMQPARPPPLPAPQRKASQSTITSATSNAGPRQLPFRAYAPTPPPPPPPSSVTAAAAADPRAAAAASAAVNPLGLATLPRSPVGAAPRATLLSPGPTKTTLLSPRRDHFAPKDRVGAQALFSAGLATPYSPYMPFSPVTPVTPRLVGREERRRRIREEGRRVVTEGEQVKDEAEIWGDVY